MRICHRIAAVLFLLSWSAFGGSWYLDRDATGLANGTNWANAWTNPAYVVWGASGVKAGDTLYISGGTVSTTYTNGLVFGAQGTYGSPITIRVGQDAGHNGLAIFDGAQHGNHCTTANIWNAQGLSYITINGEVNGERHLVFQNWRNYTNGNICAVFQCNAAVSNTFAWITVTNVNTPFRAASHARKMTIAYCDLAAFGTEIIDLSQSDGEAPTYFDSHLVYSNTLRSGWVWAPFYIEAYVTVTSVATEGATITVNGTQRTWTSDFSATHIATNLTSTAACASNLAYAFTQYPQTDVAASASSSVVTFRGNYDTILTIERSAGWSSMTYYTNAGRGGSDGVDCDSGVSVFNNKIEMNSSGETNVSDHCDYLQCSGNYIKWYNNDIENTQDSQCSPAHWSGGSIHDILIYNNIFRFTDHKYDPWPQCIRFYDGNGVTGYTNIIIINNLFIDRTNGTQAIYIGEETGAAPGVSNVMANNIFVNVGCPAAYNWELTSSQSAWTITNNLYYHKYASSGWANVKYVGAAHTVAEWKANHDPSTITNIPAFASYTEMATDNDFHLVATDTNAINKGLDYSVYFTKDKDGKTRTGTWDLGPYEYSASPVSIDTQPASVTKWPGENAIFTVVASGNAPITYQWKLGGTDIPGATTSSYTTNRVHLTATGNSYTVGVTNAEGGEISDTAVLTVTMKPQPIPCKYAELYSVEPRAIRAYTVVDTNAGTISICWPTNALGNRIVISRRVYTNNPAYWAAWTPLYTNAAYPMPEGEYTDATVSSGIHYEYSVRMDTTNLICGVSNAYAWFPYQYISAGREVPLKDVPGNVVLLVESGLAASIGSELTTLTNDLIGAGYKVFRHDIAAKDLTESGWYTAVTNTKALVVADYNTAPTTNWTLFIVGHVPIPYSGDSSPGSHTDNLGAHPADWYYSDVDGTWTDTTVNDSTSDWPHHYNIPGDGKFDQNYPASFPEMRLGRVDLRNLPAFGKTEVQLLQQYLLRDHQWRHKLFTVTDRSLIITDAIPVEAHSLYSSLHGAGTNYDMVNWLDITTNAAHSYLIADSDASGSYTKDNTLGTVTNFAEKGVYAVFTSMLGSYYGDWDSAMHSNVVMWAPLCSTGYALTTFYHERRQRMDMSHMGEAVAADYHAMASAQLRYAADGNVLTKTYRTRSYYYMGGGENEVCDPFFNYNQFCGDPTLKLRVVAPPTNVVATTNGSDVVLTWTAPSETSIQGYHVYRAPTGNLNAFTRLTTVPDTASPYTDTGGAGAAYTYWVRTVKLEDTPQRSFYNASQGVFAEAGAGGTAASVSVPPASWSTNAGGSATFTVTAAGDPTITYQWKLNGSDITGATTSAYTTNGIYYAANGNSYTVGVSNSYGGELSTAATLTVQVAHPYSTEFTLEENPISEYGVWANGSLGGSWTNFWSTNGMAIGRMRLIHESQAFSDASAILRGTWGATQEVSAVVSLAPGSVSTNAELELRLRSAVGGTTNTGYECLWSMRKDAQCYIEIVRWNGASNDWTRLDGTHLTGSQYVLSDGDVLKATITNTTVTMFLNGLQINSGTDLVWSNGAPGIGQYQNDDQGGWTNYGFKSFYATDYTTNTYTPAATSSRWNNVRLRGATIFK